MEGNSRKIGNYFTLTTHIIGILICIRVLFAMFKSYKSNNNIYKFAQGLLIFHVFSWLSRYIIEIIGIICDLLNYFINPITTPIVWYSFTISNRTFETLGECSLFALLLYRLYVTFIGSPYQLTKYGFIILVSILIIIGVLQIIGRVIMTDVIISVIYPFQHKIGATMIIIVSCFYMLFGITLIYLFTKKLFSFIVGIHVNTNSMSYEYKYSIVYIMFL